jgi:leader peptidase (prepilin peptidase)/N-methyltransferase
MRRAEENLVNAPWPYTPIVFFFGAAIGSFLNVVVHRLPRGIAIFPPTPACPLCGNRTRGMDIVPLLSYAVRKGKCRNCGKRIPYRYPLLELVTGLLWVMTWRRLSCAGFALHTSILVTVVSFCFVSIVVAIAVIDLEHMLIPDVFSLGGLIMALAVAPFLPAAHSADTPWRALLSPLFGAVIGCGVSLVIHCFGNIAFREQIKAAREVDSEIDSALGFGDVKLMAFFGAFLGWRGAVVALVSGAMVGAVMGCLRKLLSGDSGGAPGVKGIVERWKTGNSVIPFGPFLCLGALLHFFFGPFENIF